MKIVFCLFNYFPYGGLQRDFMRIAQTCIQRGHAVEVYTMRWDGERDPKIPVHIVKVSGWSNHQRARSFASAIGKLLQNKNNLVVGFNKMPHLDIYYAADVCYQARIMQTRSFLYRLLPRYNIYKDLESAVFQAGAKTDILLISPLQEPAFRQIYQTEAERFHLLPPGIQRDRIAPSDAQVTRAAKRKALQLDKDQLMLLMVGSGYATKGLDRAIKGLAALPSELKAKTHLYVLGKGNAKPYQRLAKRLGVGHITHIVGPSKDVPAYLLAADLLIHPAYHENTGTAILEAMAAGLPVLTTQACGYAHYVTDAEAGLVLTQPFNQPEWNKALEMMLFSGKLKDMGNHGLSFTKTADIYSMPERAVDLIEAKARQRVIS